MKTARRYISAGEAPDKVVFIGDKKVDNIKVKCLNYDHDHINEFNLDADYNFADLDKQSGIKWIQVFGVHDINFLNSIGKHYDIHPLILADIANTEHNPKMDILSKQVFVELKHMNYKSSRHILESEQLSIVLGKDYVLSFLEKDDDLFSTIEDRIKTLKQKISTASSGFLFYSLIDLIVDNYYSILEEIGEDIELLEDKIISKPNPKDIEYIHNIKHSLIFLRKAIWPLREIIKKFEFEAEEFYEKSEYIYLRDLYDHIIQIIDTVETQREILAEILDIYLSSVSNKLNQIMKVLTIISTIFIPLTFISSIYGMNFKFMPELEWQLGYPFIMSFMALLSIIMLIMFKRKGWFN